MVGNTYDVVVLSSSPPAASPLHTPPSRRVAMHPSSPYAFSPPASPLIKTLGASRPNSRAAPIPEGGVRGFATVGSLVRSEHFTSRLDDEFAEIQSAQEWRGSLDVTGEDSVFTKKPQKRTTKKAPADGIEKPKPKPRARKQQFKSATQIDDSDEELRLSPRPPTKFPFFDGKPEGSLNADATTDAPKLTKSGKPRKPRAKKQKVDEDGAKAAPKPKKAKVTKLKAAKKNVKGQRDDTDTVSAHFRKDAEEGGEASTPHEQATRTSAVAQDTNNRDTSIWDIPQSPPPKKKTAPKQRPPDPLAQGLELDEAVIRRRDWTPPPADTTIQTPFTDSTEKENQGSVQNADGTFTNLLSNFAYAQSPSVAKASNSTTEVMAATKRRRVELVEIPSNETNSRASSPEKGKAPKKKPRTITDLVTEQYAPKVAELDINAVTSDFFSPRTTTAITKVPLNDTPDAPPKKAPRKRNTLKSSDKADPKPRAKKGSVKAAKSKPVVEKLLSPASALMRMNRQDILFGTSSQLALEESPTMIRQLQYAIKESEQDVGSYSSLAPPPRFKMQGNRELWAVSARDDEGGILQLMEDMRVPEPDRTQDFPLLMDGAGDERDEPPEGRNEQPDAFMDINDIHPDPPSAIFISSDLPTPPRPPARASMTKPSEVGSPMKGVVFEDIDDYQHSPPSKQNEAEFEDIDNYQEPPPSNQNANSQNSNSFVDIEEFDFLPSAQMQASPAMKFRPPTSTNVMDGSPKKRGRPPKSQSAIPSVGKPSTPVLKPIPANRKLEKKAKDLVKERKPSTPPRGSVRFIDIEEILDSEDEALEAFSPTPPRMCNLPNIVPLPLISLSPTRSPKPAKAKTKPPPSNPAIHKIPKSHLEWTNIKPQIYAKVSAHIRSLRPTTDPTKPTWHEKILMYTPVVLEDFTLYLNTVPVPAIRVFKKATLKQVKVYNAGLKGQGEPVVSVTDAEDEVLAVEKELESAMVQGWCESLSICCVYGEGKGRGARKGLY
jgi:hypothetical protein